MNAHGSEQRILTRKPENAFPAWSPDGGKIAFVSNRDGNLEIYVMNSDGSGQRRLTRHPGVDGSPAWSPDGRSIACGCERGGNFDIYVISADGSGQRRLTREPRGRCGPELVARGTQNRLRAQARRALEHLRHACRRPDATPIDAERRRSGLVGRRAEDGL